MDVRALVVTWPENAPRGAVRRFCREHGVSTSWFYDVRARARLESTLSALAPRPRSVPDPHPQAVPAAIEELAVRIRKEKLDAGWDHGARSVRHALLELGLAAPAASTLHRIFVRRGMVVAQPQKRPHAAYRRFEAALVDEMWQLDAYDWRLANGLPCTIFNLLDDCSRSLISRAAPAETSQAALAITRAGIAAWQVPCVFLTDNGSALNPARRGRQGQLATFLRSLGCKPITGRVDHPQTQGKDERVHQTQQRWLRAQDPPATLTDLQALLDHFDEHYNHRRPHQALQMRTPAQARRDRPHAVPPLPPPPQPAALAAGADRPLLKARKVPFNGNIIVGKARVSIYLDARYHSTTVMVLATDQTVTIFDAKGVLIKTIQLEPGKRYYGNGLRHGRAPSRRPTKSPD